MGRQLKAIVNRCQLWKLQFTGGVIKRRQATAPAQDIGMALTPAQGAAALEVA